MSDCGPETGRIFYLYFGHEQKKLFATAFIACSDDDSSDKVVPRTVITEVNSIYELGKCGDENEGDIVYAKEQDAEYYCHEESWTPVPKSDSLSSAKSSSSKASSSSMTKDELKKFNDLCKASGGTAKDGACVCKELTQIRENLHLHAAFLGAESCFEQVEHVGARHVHDGATEPAGGFRDGLHVKWLQEQVEHCRRFPIVRPFGQKIADVETLAVDFEYRAQEAVKRRIVGDKERHVGVRCGVSRRRRDVREPGARASAAG